MKVQCQACYCVIEVDDVDLGSAMLCGQCQQVINVPPTYDSANVLIGDDFIVRRRLGEGGMGAVHLAHQVSLDREVALKLLHPQFTRDRDFVVDFVKEARTAAKLNHPNIVQAYAVGEERTGRASIYYIAMEFIEGESVQEILRRDGKVSVPQCLEIVRSVAAALDHAWEVGNLIHRDIKPDNIMIRRHDGAVKLADLGLAIPAAEVDTADEEINATPQYLCPENLLGDNMDIRGDIYSLGATLYHMLTGTYPHDGDTGIEIARKHLSEPLVPPSTVDPNIPEPVSQLVVKMMMKKPSDRYPGPKALLDAIDAAAKALKKKRRSSNTGGMKRKFRSGPGVTSTNMSRSAVTSPKSKTIPRPGTETNQRPSTEVNQGPVMPPQPAGLASPRKGVNPQIFIVLGIFVVGIVIVIAMVATRDKDGPPPVAPPQQVEAPAEQPPPASSSSGSLDELIADAEAYAAANAGDVDGQMSRWKKARTEAVTQRSPQAQAIQAKINELRDRR